MSDVVPATRYRPPVPPIAWLMRLLTAAALAVSGVLLYQSSQGSGLPGCGEGSGCDAVLNSPWSKVGSVPAALLAVVVYAVMLAAMTQMKRRLAWAVLLVGAVAAIGAAGWFTYVQVSQIGALCKYCLTVHVCGAAAGLLVWINAPLGRRRVAPEDPPDTMMFPAIDAGALALIGLLGAAIVAGVQVVYPAPSTRVSLLEGSLRFDVREFPRIGPIDAPVVIAEMYDYTCPYCREMEMHLRAARERYGDQFVVVGLPTPLDMDCNPHIMLTERQHEHACELARLAMAVWHADRSKFPQMHTWLFDHQDQITVAEARAKARELVGDEALEKTLDLPEIGERFRINADLHAQLTGGLPQLLTGSVRIQGRPPSQEELFRILEENTPLQPLAPAATDEPQ